MKDGKLTVASRIDRLIYSRGDDRRRSKSQTRERSPGSSTSKGLQPPATLETNPLQQAVFRGCVECIRILVETPPYVSVDKTCGPEGLRPIHIAAREGHLSVLRFLAKCGGNVDKYDAHGSTGLHHAAWGGQLRAARWLLRHGATLTLDKRGKTPIQVAADLGHTEIVTLLTNHSSCGTLHPGPKVVPYQNPSANGTISVATDSRNDEGYRKSPPVQDEPLLKPPQCVSLVKSQGFSKFSKLSNKSQQDLSSSGNFSLGTTVTSSGSTSPLSISNTAAAAAACTTCADTEHSGTIGSKPSKIDTVPTVASFYLHSPRISPTVTPSSTNHRQVTVSVAVEPFYLHPPPSPVSPTSSQTVDESTPGAVTPEMGPVTPVASSADFVKPNDTSPSDTEKTEESQSQASSTAGSPPPTPPTPPPKTKPTLKPPAIKSDCPPPPPPPPPMPGSHTTISSRHSTYYSGEENEYEDIDEMEDQRGRGSVSRKLNRSISVPAPPHRNGTMNDPSYGLHHQPKGVPPGSRRPFIPPNFPDPPKDALIKPSEYLKSIQKSKFEPAKTGPGLRPLRPTTTRLEDVIKGWNGTDMAAVPEEKDADEEHYYQDEPAERNHGYGRDDMGGNIRVEELMKVNLRKTPMSRTLSAPILGRVYPEVNGGQLDQRSGQMHNAKQQVCYGTPPRAAIIAELAESSQVGGVREWKEELRRRNVEDEKAAAKEIASIYSPLKFVAEVPEADEKGTPIPDWKRQMLAKKAAEKAKKEAEEQRKLEAEAKRASAIPPWKRQLLQRRDSDSKSAQ